MRLLILLILACFIQPYLAVAQNPLFETIRVFDSKEDGYASTRDPALCLTKQGTLLAFCEARFDNPKDWASIDLLMRRSTDGGKTWNKAVIISPRQEGKPTANLTPIVEQNGTIHLLYQIDYARAYHIESTDDGLTWSKPIDITAVFEQFRPDYDWKVIAPGPGHAIQLQRGRKAGRLLVGVWLCKPNPKVPRGDHRPSCVSTIYSDDHGKTWQRGEILLKDNPNIPNPSENHPVELSDGRVMLDVRSESLRHRRVVQFSPDGATGWSEPQFSTRYEPVCNAAIETMTIRGQDGAKQNRMVFCNPDSESDTVHLNINAFRKRINLTMRLSYDDGKTWPVKKTIEPGRTGYCDVATNSRTGMIYVMYEQGEGHKSPTVPASLYVARFNLAWLTDGQDTLR